MQRRGITQKAELIARFPPRHQRQLSVLRSKTRTDPFPPAPRPEEIISRPPGIICITTLASTVSTTAITETDTERPSGENLFHFTQIIRELQYYITTHSFLRNPGTLNNVKYELIYYQGLRGRST